MIDVTAEMVVMDVTVEMVVTVATHETDVTDETAVTVEAAVMSHLKMTQVFPFYLVKYVCVTTKCTIFNQFFGNVKFKSSCSYCILYTCLR